MKFLIYLLQFLIILLLTVLTQVGGILYLICLLLGNQVFKSYRPFVKALCITFLFFSVHLLNTLLILPRIAMYYNRIALPISNTSLISPARNYTWIFNRHYISKNLYDALVKSSALFHKRYPNTQILYLDGNFPLFKKFPLLPHLSHNDGNKLDLSFQYNDSTTGNPKSQIPSWFGYGVFEGPREGEIDMPKECAQKGFWQYSSLQYITTQRKIKKLTFSVERNVFLMECLLKQPSIRKIFIEPHLIKRLSISSTKLRFHGCQAVRHDGHIHIQL